MSFSHFPIQLLLSTDLTRTYTHRTDSSESPTKRSPLPRRDLRHTYRTAIASLSTLGVYRGACLGCVNARMQPSRAININFVVDAHFFRTDVPAVRKHHVNQRVRHTQRLSLSCQ